MIFGWSVLCVAVGLTLYLRNRQTSGTQQFFDPVLPVVGLAFPLTGALLASGRRRDPIVWLFFGGGLSAAAFLAEQYALHVIHAEPGRLTGGELAAWFSTWAWAPAYLGALTLLPLLFPDGLPPSPRWRPLMWAVILCVVATCVLAALAPENLASPAARNPIDLVVLQRMRGLLQAVCLFGLAPLCLAVLLSRYRQSSAVVRAQLSGFAAASAVTSCLPLAGLLLALSGISLPDGLYQAAGVVSIVALATAVVGTVLKRGRHTGDATVNTLLAQALTCGSLAAGAVTAYIAVLVTLAALIPGPVRPASVFISAGVAGVVTACLRNRVQESVDRLIYRKKDYDYSVLASLGQRLGSTLGPDGVLPVIAETVALALKLPYVDIRAGRGEDVAATATYGEPSSETATVKLVHQNEVVGRLVVSPRGSGQPFDEADRRLLDELAAQAGVAAYALCLATDLQRSRERLVAAREEERRRLRRDLHDGLKPTLAGVGLGLNAVGNLLGDDVETASSLLERLRCELEGATSEIRRLVDDLRPAALDELGLVGALRQQASRFQLSPTTPDVSLDAPVDIAELPAAVEVAAYRIGQEALENVRTHANASSCAVSLRITDAHLELEVIDDGGGVTRGGRTGVGLLAMQERAAELGGSCSIESRAGKGTCIRARLPLGSP